MTRNEFVQSRAEFVKRDRRFNIVYLVVFFGLLILAIPLSSYVPKTYNTESVIGILALLAVNAIIIVWSGLTQAKRAGLVCHSCKRGLPNVPGNIAVTTGNCPHCGKQALASDV